ncbi:hypothetical protein GCM10027422_38210 [Hymenobacter arcticus]
MQRAALACSVASGERYLDALRVHDAATRASQLRHLTAGTRQDATRSGRLDTAAFTAHQRYAAALAARPRYTMRPGLTPEERLWLNTVASMPYEMALMVRLDPVVRSVGGAVAVVGAVEGVTAVVAEEVTAYSSLRWLGWKATLLRFGANAVGQEIGYTIQTRDMRVAFRRINWVSSFLSASGLPLVTTSVGSAAFKFDIEQRYRSVFNGGVSNYELARDSFLNYGFGQATRLSGLDDWHRTPQAMQLIGGLRYQISLRLSTRLAAGLEPASPAILEAGNRTAAGAIRKHGTEEAKKHLPK